jgi:hypothetical protein
MDYGASSMIPRHENEICKRKVMLGVGFEPTPPERVHLKCNALDHSAIQAKVYPKYASDGENVIFNYCNLYYYIA